MDNTTIGNTGLDPRTLAENIIQILNDKNARDTKLLYVEKQTIIADYFVICNGTSSTQIKALADEVQYKLSLTGFEPAHIEGVKEGTWILLDYSSVIVHIFSSEARQFYNLDKLWSEGQELNTTSESQELNTTSESQELDTTSESQEPDTTRGIPEI